MKEKLSVKDLINIGIFSAIYIVVMMAIVTAMGTIPIFYLVAPFFVGIGCASVYMLMAMRVRKPGVALILSIMLALLFTSMNWMASLFAIFCGLVAEWILNTAGRQNEAGIRKSFLAMSCATTGPYLGIVFMKQTFIDSTALYYGQEYAVKLDALTPTWIVFAIAGLAVLGALVGNKFAKRVLGKHFKKAGIV